MTTETTHQLRIDDGCDWHFVNGAWEDGADGAITVPDPLRRSDGPNLQGHHYTFRTAQAYRDVRVRFAFRLTGHSDAGIILRAKNASHFSLVHFPNCGQGSRAQHFWAALSQMDDSGYLRCRKLEMVRRVPSNSGLWLTAEIALIGNKLIVHIGDHGLFEAEVDTAVDAGAIGVYTVGGAVMRNVEVAGAPVTPFTWNAQAQQPTNWFHPCPRTPAIWQKMRDLVRLPDGELLLTYSEQDPPYSGPSTEWLARSGDGGRTWSAPEALSLREGGDQWQRARLHVTPAGRLIAWLCLDGEFQVAESRDGARTWSAPEPVNVGPKPKHLKAMHVGPQAFCNCRDGSMVLFVYGGCDLAAEDLGIHTWGALHCQAFACRSTDDGRTWSPSVNVDRAAFGIDADPVEGNLDLTEVCGAEMGQDGRIMALVRPVYSPWMWETWSHDGGATWSPCVRGPFPGYATPNMLRTSNGAVLVGHRLPSLTIHCSRDDGHTWDQGTMIDGALWVMGGMVEVEPDLVLYVYWDSHESLLRGQCIRVTAHGLEPVLR